MKVLCLHGMGTSAEILQAQMSRITPLLEALGHEFVFVDGLETCDSTEGKRFEYHLQTRTGVLGFDITSNFCSDIKTIYPPPYLAYYPIAYPHLIESAQSYIHEVIEDEGPFDGVMGFSQGGALAASLILEHNKTDPSHALFKFAIFVCATLPFNADDCKGLESWKFAKSGKAKLQHEFAGEVEVQEPLGFPDDLSEPILGRYHPDKTPMDTIKIPTFHLVGKIDPYGPQSETLAAMCEPAQRSVMEHSGGHRVPKDAKTSSIAAKSIAVMLDRIGFAQ